MADTLQIMNCDFCNAPCPARTYRTADSSTVRMRAFMESGPVLQEHHFTPVWEACDSCGEFIDAGDWDGLTTRVMHSLAALGVPESKAIKEWLQLTYGELKAAGMMRVR
jgi:hypothetical protein